MDIQVIILAAGQGLRLHPLTKSRPKSLLPFNAQPLLVRTISQLHNIGLHKIRVIVGYMHKIIQDTLCNSFGNSIKFIHNKNYLTDMNSYSLYLGLTYQPTLLIESDVVLSNECLPIIQKTCQESHSSWFTHGRFQPHQMGGIIKSDENKNIIDMRIVSHFESRFEFYSKNLGVVYIGPQEIGVFKNFLDEGIKHSQNIYYMQHWINHLTKLPCREVNLSPHPAGSFNTIHEYKYCQKLFNFSDLNLKEV